MLDTTEAVEPFGHRQQSMLSSNWRTLEQAIVILTRLRRITRQSLRFIRTPARSAWIYRPSDLRNGCDQDFGASPNLIAFGDRQYLGEGGKDGTYYLLERVTGDLVWSQNVVFGGSAGGFFGASFDGQRIYAATALGDGNIATQDPTGLCAPSDPRDTLLQEPSMHAFNVEDGAVIWEQTGNQSTAPTSAVHDVVFSGLIGIEGFGLNAYDTRSGKLLIQLPMSGSVNSAATPLGDKLFVTAGSSTDGTGSGVFAFALQGEASEEELTSGQ